VKAADGPPDAAFPAGSGLAQERLRGKELLHHFDRVEVGRKRPVTADFAVARGAVSWMGVGTVRRFSGSRWSNSAGAALDERSGGSSRRALPVAARVWRRRGATGSRPHRCSPGARRTGPARWSVRGRRFAAQTLDPRHAARARPIWLPHRSSVFAGALVPGGRNADDRDRWRYQSRFCTVQ
jgi:hypothetical protein